MDAECAAGRVHGPFHGVPVLFKDNIDVLGLATTGGSRGLVDHCRAWIHGGRGHEAGRRGRCSARPTWTNSRSATLESAARRHRRKCLRSVAEHLGLQRRQRDGGAASLAALAFGTDTCNSLSNPASFASLATIRTTRGLTSRAGVMPLNTYNDAVGPIAKSVRDWRSVLDLVPEPTPKTRHRDAARTSRSFAARSRCATLKAHVGVLRQRFVGVTGEREAAADMERVIKGAAVRRRDAGRCGDPDYDAIPCGARQRARSLKAAWDGVPVARRQTGRQGVDIEVCSRPASSRRPARGASKTRWSRRRRAPRCEEATRGSTPAVRRFELFCRLDGAHPLDALLYPANQARPHTHEGGLERTAEPARAGKRA